MRRTQPSTKRPKFLQQPMSNGYMVNNNIILTALLQGVDPVARRNLWTIIQRIQKNGQAVVLTSHSMEVRQSLFISPSLSIHLIYSLSLFLFFYLFSLSLSLILFTPLSLFIFSVIYLSLSVSFFLSLFRLQGILIISSVQ